MANFYRFPKPSDPEVNDFFLEVLVFEEALLLEGVVSDIHKHFLGVVPVEDLRTIEGISYMTKDSTVGLDVLKSLGEVNLPGVSQVRKVNFEHLLVGRALVLQPHHLFDEGLIVSAAAQATRIHSLVQFVL